MRILYYIFGLLISIIFFKNKIFIKNYFPNDRVINEAINNKIYMPEINNINIKNIKNILSKSSINFKESNIKNLNNRYYVSYYQNNKVKLKITFIITNKCTIIKEILKL